MLLYYHDVDFNCSVPCTTNKFTTRLVHSVPIANTKIRLVFDKKVYVAHSTFSTNGQTVLTNLGGAVSTGRTLLWVLFFLLSVPQVGVSELCEVWIMLMFPFQVFCRFRIGNCGLTRSFNKTWFKIKEQYEKPFWQRNDCNWSPLTSVSWSLLVVFGACTAMQHSSFCFVNFEYLLHTDRNKEQTYPLFSDWLFNCPRGRLIVLWWLFSPKMRRRRTFLTFVIFGTPLQYLGLPKRA